MNKTMKIQALLAAVAILAAWPAHADLPPPPESPPPVNSFEYDAEGHVTKITRASGTMNLQTQRRYDAQYRLKDSVDARNGTTSISYDGGGRPTQVTDPRGLATQYPRNGLGDARELISPDTGRASHTYDAARRLKTRTDSRGVLTTFDYDAMHRPTQATYSQSSQLAQVVQWRYDERGPGFAYGGNMLTSTGYAAGSTQYAYTPHGETNVSVQRTEPAAGANSMQLTHTVVYGWSLGDLVSLTYPSGRRLSIDRIRGKAKALSLSKDASSPPVPLITAIQWEPFAWTMSGWQWNMTGGAVAHERFFDLSKRMNRYRLGNVFRDLRYDEANRIASFTHLLPDGTPQPALDQRFGYDENNRLTGIEAANASWSISYDPNGNRTGMSLNGSLSNYATEPTSNRLASITNPARSFGYDNAGNTTSDSGADQAGYQATYDLRGQLVTLTKAGVTTTYDYNAFGQRIRKHGTSGTSSTVIFVYDKDGQLLGEYDASGAPIREYVWLRSTPIAMFMPDPANPSGEPLVYYIHTDHLDAPRIVVDRDNHVRWRWLAEPFGTTAPETNPEGLGAFTQNLRFPGQYADQESGLFYNYHRYYAAEGGQYRQSDPIGLAGGSVSTYGYVGGNPLSFVDSTGLKLPADSAHCKALRDKMGRKNQKLDERYVDYAKARGASQLPERVSPTELLSQSRRGHRTLINMEDSSLRKVEQRYAEECEDEPPSPPAAAAGAPDACPVPNAQVFQVTRNILYGVGAAAGATAVVACIAAEPCGVILGAGAAVAAVAK